MFSGGTPPFKSRKVTEIRLLFDACIRIYYMLYSAKRRYDTIYVHVMYVHVYIIEVRARRIWRLKTICFGRVIYGVTRRIKVLYRKKFFKKTVSLYTIPNFCTTDICLEI